LTKEEYEKLNLIMLQEVHHEWYARVMERIHKELYKPPQIPALFQPKETTDEEDSNGTDSINVNPSTSSDWRSHSMHAGSR
jgi:hypothetical protein